MIQPAFEILNQRGTPMFFSDTFANRPTAGVVGRIFISTDTYAFYRDTGSGWDLIGGPGSGTITGSGTAGRLTKFTGASTIGDSIVSESGSAITINGTGKANNWYVGTPNDLTRAFAAAGNANDIALWLEEYTTTGGGTPDIFLRNGRGTISSKANIQVGDSLGGVAWAGYLGSTFSDSASFSTSVVNIDLTNNHADVDVRLYQSYNSATLTENFKVRASDGYVVATNGGFETTGNINLFAGANTRRFVMDANDGVPRIFSFRTGNLPRWAFRVDGSETGSNAGADFAIRRYDDAGAYISSPISIIRSTGQTFVGTQTTASGLLVVNNASADAHIQVVGASAPSIRIDNAGTGATQRFVMGLATATNNFIQGSTAGDICISTASASPLLFGMWQTINASEVMRISTSNNLLVGTSVDTGDKFQNTGNAYINGNVGIGNNQYNPQVRLRIRSGFSTYASDLATSVSLATIQIATHSGDSTITTFSGFSNGDAIIQRSNGSGTTPYNILLNPFGKNVGIGTTNVLNSYSDSTSIEIGASGIIWSEKTASIYNSLAIGSNYYYDNGGNPSYKNTGIAVSRYTQYQGNHQWYYAASGTAGNVITFSNPMTLKDTGNLLIGTTTDGGQKLQVNGSARITGDTTITSTTASISPTTGALVVSGGIGFSGVINGGTAGFSGNAFSYFNRNDAGTVLKIQSQTAFTQVDFLSSGTTYANIYTNSGNGTLSFYTGVLNLVLKSNGVINMPNLPTSAVGLVSGDLWNNLGIINIVP